MKKMTLEDLAKEYNENNESSNNNEDKRLSDELSPRRIRDYVTKGLLTKPLKEGRYAYYTEQHLEELKNLRKLQTGGFTESYLQKNYSYNENDNDNDFKNRAQSALNSIIGQSKSDDDSLFFGSSSKERKNPAHDFLRNYQIDVNKTVEHRWEVNENIQINIQENTKLSEANLKKTIDKITKILKENYHD